MNLKEWFIKKLVAEKLLIGVIRKSVIFVHPEDFVLARDTSFVESFNNIIDICSRTKEFPSLMQTTMHGSV